MTIDLSKLAAPTVVEPLDYNTILSDMVMALEAATDSSGNLLFTSSILESDPAQKILEIVAARELNLRQRVNDAALDVMLAFATGTNLGQLAVLFGIDPARYSSDTALKAAIQAAPSSWSSAGPSERYRQTALGVAGVKDAWAANTAPGEVTVYVLSDDDADGAHDGTPTQTLLDAVAAALNGRYVRPLSDTVVVAAATVTHYTVDITLTLATGPDPTTVVAAAQAAAEAYTGYVAPATPAAGTVYGSVDAPLGREITMAGLIEAAMSPAAINAVVVTALVSGGATTDVKPGSSGAAFCDSVLVHTQ